MKFRITKNRNIVVLIITILCLLGSVGCDSQSGSKSGNAISEGSGEMAGAPQAGTWEGEFSFKNKNDVNCNWTISFVVNEGGKTIAGVQAVYYYGELASDTQVSFFDFPNEIEIEKNTFEFYVTEWSGYSSYNYDGKVIFTSETEARGTLDIDDIEHEWTAVPFTE